MDDVLDRPSAVVPANRRQPQRVRLTLAGAQLGASAGSAVLGFVLAYGVLHWLHVAGIEFALLARLAPIPLFAAVLGSCPFALLGFVLAAFSKRSMQAQLAMLPRALIVVCALFVLEILLFP
jgi:hypothetical protein